MVFPDVAPHTLFYMKTQWGGASDDEKAHIVYSIILPVGSEVQNLYGASLTYAPSQT